MRLRDTATAVEQKYNVVVVDDEQGIIDTISIILNKEKFAIKGFTDGGNAVEYLRDNHADILVLDFLLEGMTGKQVVEEIRKFNREVYIILLTGHSDLAPPLQTLIDLDIQGYCEKGTRFDQLILLVESAVKSINLSRRLVTFHKGMAAILRTTPSLYELRPVNEVVRDIQQQFVQLIGCEDSIIIQKEYIASFKPDPGAIVWGTGKYNQPASDLIALIMEQFSPEVDATISSKQVRFTEHGAYLPLTNQVNNHTMVIFVDSRVTDEMIDFINVFHHHAQTAFTNAVLHSVVHNKNFELQTLLSSLQDNIQKQKALENELHHSQKMDILGRMAGGIAHDFNNILTVIVGYSRMMLKGSSPAHPDHSKINNIFKAATHATDLVTHLLAFSQRQVMERSPVALNEVILSLQRMLSYICGNRITIKLELDDSLWPVLVNKTQMEQVLMNLVVNARDAMPAGGGTITLRTMNIDADEIEKLGKMEIGRGDYVHFSIADTGCGMDQEVVEHIFEPFFTTKEKGKGTGLGLSTVYGIVKQSDGYIYVDSVKNQGTTFNIYIPRSVQQEKEQKTERKLPNDGKNNGSTILLVDDQEDVRLFIQAVLEDSGYRVLETGSPKAACTLFDQNHVDLLLTDIMMPEMDGRELYRNLAQKSADFKTLFMSGYIGSEVNALGFYSTERNFISKPFSTEDLLDRINLLLTESPPIKPNPQNRNND